MILLAFRQPFDWRGLLEFIERRQIPGIESVADGRYRRNTAQGVVEVRLASDGCSLEATLPDESLVARVRHLFDLDAEPDAIRAVLGRDPQLNGILSRHAGLRVPGCWDPFEVSVRAIMGQQVSVAAATTMTSRLVRAFGPPTPAGLATAALETVGVVRARAASIRALAAAVLDRRIVFEEESGLDARIAQLTALPGIGPWTANYIAMRACHCADAFPSADLILRRAASMDGKPLHARELEARSQAWRPFRAYATIALWREVT